jgi:maltose O-acetyltransferase
MASIAYLWRNRTKNTFLSKAYFKTWAKRIFNLKELIARNIRRSTLIRKGAKIAETAEIGVIQFTGKKTLIEIGDFTFIGRVHIALHDKVSIGNRVCINDGVEILTASHNINCPNWSQNSKPVVINDYAWIATNAIILPGVTIGKGVIVGAGAVVRQNVADFEIVIGNPAVPIDKTRTKNLDYNPCEFLASNRAWLK